MWFCGFISTINVCHTLELYAVFVYLCIYVFVYLCICVFVLGQMGQFGDHSCATLGGALF